MYNDDRMTSEDDTAARRPRIRWWPAPVILTIGVIAHVAVQTIKGDTNQQLANMGSGAAFIGAAGLLGLWLLFFARLSRRNSLGILAALSLAALLLLAGFRIRGVTGNLVPLFEWRWSSAAADVTAQTPEQPSEETLPGIADYPQFLGPARDGVLAGPALARDWSATPPVELWRREVGAGWAGFAVRGHRAVTLEQHGDEEAVTCYDVANGRALWIHRYPARYFRVIAGLGPRSTPTIAGDRVFALGATGILNCLDLQSGEVVWSTNCIVDSDATVPEWGMSGSPLVLGDKVVVSVGGPDGRSLVAYSSADGAFAWGGGSDSAEYSSPQVASFHGVEQLLIFNTHSVAAHAPADGELLWEHPWKPKHPHVSQPVPLPGDRLLISSGYGTGSQLVQVSVGDAGDWSTSRIWRSLSLKAKFTNLIAIADDVYGLDDGILTCVNLGDGRRRWKSGRYGHGQIVLVGELLLVMAEAGDVVLVEPSPDERRELSRFTALTSKTWNPPAVAGAYLLVRNDLEAACYRLPLRGDD